jgi:RNA-binding protein YlmH
VELTTPINCFDEGLLNWSPPLFQFLQREFALQLTSLLPVSNFSFQGRQKIEGNICRLKLFRISMGDVMQQRSQRRCARRSCGSVSRN